MTRSRSLLLTGPRRLTWVEKDLPPPASNEVLVETIAGAISVGSELPLFGGVSRGTHSPTYPRMTGYESLGRVIDVGPDVHNLPTGARIVATYGHRTHAVVSASHAIAVPTDVGDALALLTILSCDVAKGIAKLVPPPGEPALVTGAGTIGLLTVWNLAARGLGPVDVVEPVARRRELALQLGARNAWPPSRDFHTDGEYRVGLECSSVDAAFALLQLAMLPEGRICVLADGNTRPLTLAPVFHERELQVVASSDGVDYLGHAQWFFGASRENAAALESLFELHVRSDDLAETFEQIAEAPDPPIKVLVRYT